MHCIIKTTKTKKIINKIIDLLVIFFLFVIVFETIWNNALLYKKEIFYIDFFVSFVFLIEYVLNFYCAGSKKRFLFSFYWIIDFLSFAPFFVLLFLSYFIHSVSWDINFVVNILVTLRLFRIFKVLRLIEEIPLTAWFINSLKDYKDEYKAVFILFFIILYILSFAVYFFEHSVNPNLNNMLKALWWWLVTMTTVWYGDIVPITWIGKVIASVLIFIWPLILGIFSAITIMVFMDSTERHRYIIFAKLAKRIKFCPKCNTKNLKEANYCMKCGYKLIDNEKI